MEAPDTRRSAIPPELLEMADIREYEAVNVWNVTQGTRFETYAISGIKGSGSICVNGAAAHLATPGDILIVAAFADVPESMTGLNFWPLVTGEKDAIREHAVGGFHIFGYVQDQRYHYFRNLLAGDNLHLFDLEQDGRMEKNLVESEPELARMSPRRRMCRRAWLTFFASVSRPCTR